MTVVGESIADAELTRDDEVTGDEPGGGAVVLTNA